MEVKLWFLYILKCGDGSLYTGITRDLKRRILEHAAGRGSRCVRSKLPVEIVYQRKYATHSLALKREAAIKSWPRVKKLALISGCPIILTKGLKHGKKNSDR